MNGMEYGEILYRLGYIEGIIYDEDVDPALRVRIRAQLNEIDKVISCIYKRGEDKE